MLEFNEFTFQIASQGEFSMNGSIKKGERVGLSGPSGCGKTTLLNCVAGLAATKSGSINLDGMPISQKPPALRSVNYLFSDPLLFEHLNVLENIKLPFKILKQALPLLKIDEALQVFQLEDKINSQISELSTGEKKRISLLRSLFIDKKTFLMDEAFAHLNEELKGRIIDWILTSKELDNKVCICVSHDPFVFEKFCTQQYTWPENRRLLIV